MVFPLLWGSFIKFPDYSRNLSEKDMPVYILTINAHVIWFAPFLCYPWCWCTCHCYCIQSSCLCNFICHFMLLYYHVCTLCQIHLIFKYNLNISWKHMSNLYCFILFDIGTSLQLFFKSHKFVHNWYWACLSSYDVNILNILHLNIYIYDVRLIIKTYVWCNYIKENFLNTPRTITNITYLTWCHYVPHQSCNTIIVISRGKK